jgi:phenylacetic acid degradation operon negative regulatory protein
MDERGLTARLWDLPGWTDTGARLLTALDEPRPPVERLAVAAALVRHLRTDPALSPELRPSGWNAPRLVEAYAAYQTELAASLGRPSPVRDTAR